MIGFSELEAHLDNSLKRQKVNCKHNTNDYEKINKIKRSKKEKNYAIVQTIY